MIARALNIAERTVDTHIENLRAKFFCDTKNDMIAKAISLGYLYDIPSSLFNAQLASNLQD